MLRKVLLVLVSLAMLPIALATQAQSEAEINPFGRYIVVLKDGVDAPAVKGDLLGLGATVESTFSAVGGLVARLPLLSLGSLRTDPRVSYIQPDMRVHLLAEPTPSGVTRVGAAPRLNPDGTLIARPEAKTGVAIIDTGISPHPDLNVVGGVDCSSDLLGDLLGSGGYNDDHGHGSHVAGTIGAMTNDAGVIGVSPGTPLYAVRVFGALGAGNLSDVICGLDWVAANAAEKNIMVVNMSLGGAGLDDGKCGEEGKDALHAAVCRVVAKGVTVVVAAGNSNVDLAGDVPASYDEVLAVAAMADYDGLPGGLAQPSCETNDKDDTAADFSNFANGPDANHTITAPGVCINSTWKNGGYATLSGTSMASPHVAGAVARCIDAGPCAGKSPAEIIGIMRAGAAARSADSGFFGDPNSPLDGRYYGFLLNADF